MKQSNFLLPLAYLALFFLLSSALTPPLKGCHKINAKGKGAITDMVGNVVITEADIIGGGLLNGSTRATFSFVSEDEFVGTLDLTTKHGSVHFEINDGQLTGDHFRATAVAVNGSGKLSGATGSLVLEGYSAPSGSFTEDITGEICFN